MLQKFIDAANANPASIGFIMCGIMLVAVLILPLDMRHDKRMKKRIRKLKGAVETKEKLNVQKDAEIKRLKEDIKRLKVDLFMAREDGKIALRKKQAEVDRLTARVAQLEQDKKQLTKWGTEK